jgi:hypothetical protein
MRLLVRLLVLLWAIILVLPACAAEQSASADIARFLDSLSPRQPISTYRGHKPRDTKPSETALGAYCRLIVAAGEDEEQDCTGAAVLDRREVLTAAHCFFDDVSNAFIPSPYSCTFNSGRADAVEASCRLVRLGTKHPYEASQSPYDYAILLCDPAAPVAPLALAPESDPAALVDKPVSLAGYSSDLNDEGMRISEDHDCRIAHYMRGYYTSDCGGWDGASGAPVTIEQADGKRAIVGTILGAPNGVRHDIPFDKLSDDANIVVPVARFRDDVEAVKRDLDRGLFDPR